MTTVAAPRTALETISTLVRVCEVNAASSRSCVGVARNSSLRLMVSSPDAIIRPDEINVRAPAPMNTPRGRGVGRPCDLAATKALCVGFADSPGGVNVTLTSSPARTVIVLRTMLLLPGGTLLSAVTT